jgi:hypothetical protein
MKWFKWLRKPKTDEHGDVPPDDSKIITLVSANQGVRTARNEVATHPLTTLVEPKDALLRFARDYLLASGARVRVEDTDVLSATLADGRHVRYTTSLVRARNEEDTDLLVQGGTTLAELLDECASRSRIVSLKLWETANPEVIAEAALAAPLPRCVGCRTSAASQDTARSHGTDGAAGGTMAGLQYCERCPWREGKTILDGFGPITRSRERRRYDGRSMELTFHIVSTDRSGRHDEWKRIAFDLAGGHEIALLSLESVLRMETDSEFLFGYEATALLDQGINYGQILLSDAANALAKFLRLRDAEDYQRRVDDISTTYDRLLRERAPEQDVIQDAFQRELTRLADAYTVDIDVQLDSIAIITSRIAEVELRDKAGRVIPVQVDIGRGCLLPLHCDICGETLQTGRCCSRGHLVCAACTFTENLAATPGSGCSLCAEAHEGEPRPAPQKTMPIQPATKSGKLAQGERLRVEDLDAMTAETWHLFVTWLLERMGYASERSELGETSSRFFGQQDDQQFAACALRLPKGVAVGAVEVQNVAALRAGNPDLVALLVSTTPASADASALAEQLGVTIIERVSLVTWLERLEAAHTLEIEAEAQAAEERALHADMARTRLLAELDQIEGALARAVNSRKAGSRAALLEAVEAISSAVTISTQAFLAWETLAADWNASFGDHEGRDGSLLITAESASFDEIDDRAGHLAEVILRALVQIQSTPGTGELGYTAWRKAVMEELLARCEVMRRRISIVDPSRWQVYAEARDTHELQEAEEAATQASYARGRAEKALTQLQTRARIAVIK